MKIFTLLIILFSLESFSFSLNYSNGAHFPDNKIKLDVTGDSCSVAGFNSSSELLDFAMKAADEYWNAIPTCAIEIEKGSVRSSVNIGSGTLSSLINQAQEMTILIGCSTNGTTFTSGILGVANLDANSSKRGGVLINNVDTSFANLNDSEKKAVIAHEIGHALGIGHSSHAAALMYFSVGGKVQEKMSIDDYDACTYLYPKKGPVSCMSVKLSNNEGSDGSNGNFSFLLGLFLILGFFGIKKIVSDLFLH